MIRVRDRSSNASLTFEITGLYAQRQLSGPAASYWELDSVPASGSATAGGFTTYGPLVVAPSAFSPKLAAAVSPGQLAVGTGTWVAQPDMSRFSDADLSAIPADVSALTSRGFKFRRPELCTAHHQPADRARRHRQQPGRREVAARDQRHCS